MLDLSRRDILAGALALAATDLAANAASAQAVTPAAPAAAAWDLTDLYPSDAAWAAERQAIAAALPGLDRFKGTLGQGAAQLKLALQTMSDLQRRLGRLAVYANLSADADTRVAANQENRGLAIQLAADFGEHTAWVNPEVLTLGAARISAFEAAEPGLTPFRFALDNILRAAPHTLSPESEDVLAQAQVVLSSPQQIRTQLAESDIPWPEVELSTGKVKLDNQGYTANRIAPSRDDRRKVFEAFFGAYKGFESSLGAALTAQVQGDMFTAKSRKFESSLASATFGDNIPPEVCKTLIAETNQGLPVLHRYFELRRKLLGLSEMHYYDIYPPITKIDRTFDIAEIRKLTLEAVAPLGPDYVATLSAATAKRWMDPYSRPGKASGAYMNGDAYDVHPYLLLNLDADYEGLTTYAHEWGHAMHSVLANRTQPYPTAAYPIFIAEIASTNNEQLVAHHMFETAKTKAEKLFYLDALMEQFRGTFFRQAMFAEFELAIHEAAEKGDALSGAKFSEMYLAILKKYHGDAVVVDDVVAIEWAYIPHFYYDFYVYQYATSIAASAYFSETLLSGDPKARETYLAVLKAGGSDYPVDILKRAGLDMTSPTPYRAIIAKFARTLDKVEQVMAEPG